MMSRVWTVDDWAGCYPSNWKGVVVADAMVHPAKFSSRLIRRIYEHMLEEGWVRAGDAVVDPFGGVALGALEAMRHGLHWTGVELEERFWKIGNDNISLWMGKYGGVRNWGTAQLVHGDSRELRKVIMDQVQGVASSPPFTQQQSGGGIAAGKGGRNQGYQGQGHEKGQLANMSADGFDAAISSPPFLQSEGGTPEPKPGGTIDKALYKRHAAGNAAAGAYGESDGQLSSMRGDGFDVAVSSPPFEDSLSADRVDAESRRRLARASGISNAEFISPIDMEKVGKRDQNYGITTGQLGVDSGDDFWLAARVIVEQVHQSLTPGGHACWVVKDYVKSKQIVPFSDQWRQLCEAVGFETLHEHRAMLVHHKGRQGMLDGGVHEIKTESKSFFRRLAEKKGSPRIDWEVVWCMRKP